MQEQGAEEEGISADQSLREMRGNARLHIDDDVIGTGVDIARG